MDLKSGYPFWAIKNGLMAAFPRPRTDLRCDVAVVGGGITGALIADELQRAGHDVVVLEQRDVAWGSTAASTALLQYEIDTHMVDLAKRYGEDAAVLAYRACLRAIGRLQSLARGLRDVDFARMESLYYASRRRDRRALEDEFALRRKHRFDVAWLEPGDIRERFRAKLAEGGGAPGMMPGAPAPTPGWRMQMASASGIGGGGRPPLPMMDIQPMPRKLSMDFAASAYRRLASLSGGSA